MLAVPVPELGAVLVGLTHGAGHGEPGQGVPRLTLLGGWRGGVGWDPAAHLPSAGSRPYGPVPGTACSRVRRVVHGLRDPSLSSPAPWPEGAEPGGGAGGGLLSDRAPCCAVPSCAVPCHATLSCGSAGQSVSVRGTGASVRACEAGGNGAAGRGARARRGIRPCQWV